MKPWKIMYKETSEKLNKGKWIVKSKRNAGQFASFEENKRQNNNDNNIANDDDS